jgi:hypothetical protein
MPKTLEGRVKSHVDVMLKLHGAYLHKPVQSGYGCPALDYHVCHRGFYAGIETKRDGETFTRRQARTAREILQAGGSVFLVSGRDKNSFDELLIWLQNPRAGYVGLYTAKHLSEFLRGDDDKSSDD